MRAENDKEAEKKYTATCILLPKFSINKISSSKLFNSTASN